MKRPYIKLKAPKIIELAPQLIKKNDYSNLEALEYEIGFRKKAAKKLAPTLEAIKKASFFIENKKYNEAKKILLEFAENNKNIKLDIKFFFTMYLVSNGLEDIKNSKRYLEKCLKIDDKNHDTIR